jgi:hypothetical protein
MTNCEFNSRCSFFNDKLPAMPANAADLKQVYCLSNNLHCARYLVANALGPAHMTADLFPDHKDKAYLIIAGGQ